MTTLCDEKLHTNWNDEFFISFRLSHGSFVFVSFLFVLTSLNTCFFKMLILSHSHSTCPKLYVKDSTGVFHSKNINFFLRLLRAFVSCFLFSIQRFYSNDLLFIVAQHQTKKIIFNIIEHG